MTGNTAKYDLILMGNASRQFFLLSGLTDTSTTHLYHRFVVDIDELDGEYTYAVVRNERDDVEYEFKTPVLDTILHTQDGDVLLRDLQPSTGLLRIGKDIQPVNKYQKDNNNTIFYYDE